MIASKNAPGAIQDVVIVHDEWHLIEKGAIDLHCLQVLYFPQWANLHLNCKAHEHLVRDTSTVHYVYIRDVHVHHCEQSDTFPCNANDSVHQRYI